MKRSFSILLLFLPVLLFHVTSFAQNSGQIRISVTDKAGYAASEIAKEDFALFEEKTSLEIVSLESQANKPCAVLILIDNSMSLERMLPQLRKFAVLFVLLFYSDIISIKKLFLF